MRDLLLTAIKDRGGVITRREAACVVAPHVIDDALRAGALAHVFPGVYTTSNLNDRCTRQRAALSYVADSAVSHLDGLHGWGYLPPACRELLDEEPIRLTTSSGQGEVDVPGLRVTRRQWFAPEPPYAVVRGGVRLVRLEQALIETWPQLPAAERRGPLIAAVRDRRTTADRLLSVLQLQPKTGGAGDMQKLIALLAAGCHSELELFGHAHIFSHPELRRARAQVPHDLPSGRIYMDRYLDLEMVDVEMDGSAWHGDSAQRERDLARDAAVGRDGILVIRYSHRRMHREGKRLIPELLATLAMRRQQLGINL